MDFVISRISRAYSLPSLSPPYIPYSLTDLVIYRIDQVLFPLPIPYSPPPTLLPNLGPAHLSLFIPLDTPPSLFPKPPPPNQKPSTPHLKAPIGQPTLFPMPSTLVPIPNPQHFGSLRSIANLWSNLR